MDSAIEINGIHFNDAAIANAITKCVKHNKIVSSNNNSQSLHFIRLKLVRFYYNGFRITFTKNQRLANCGTFWQLPQLRIIYNIKLYVVKIVQ